MSFGFAFKVLAILRRTVYSNATSMFLICGDEEMIAAVNQFVSIGMLSKKIDCTIFTASHCIK